MHEGIPFSQIEETEEIPRNSKFLACMGDGSGVKTVTKETMDEEMKKNIDILDSQEEIQANTDPQKVAGALAVKEMVGELNDNLSSLNTSLATASSPSTVSALSYSSIAGIKEDTNLNDLNNPGFYAVSGSAWATLAKNYPVAGLGGAVEVLRISSVGSCIQKYYGFGGYSPNVRIFCRHLYKQANGEEYWSPWVEYTYNEVK